MEKMRLAVLVFVVVLIVLVPLAKAAGNGAEPAGEENPIWVFIFALGGLMGIFKTIDNAREFLYKRRQAKKNAC